jgi:hypothetical protein
MSVYVSMLQSLCAYLDERLNAASPLQFLGAHSPRNFSRVAFDASNYGVGVWSFLCSLIELFNNDNLLACLAALQDDGDLDKKVRIAVTSITRMMEALFRACKLV